VLDDSNAEHVIDRLWRATSEQAKPPRDAQGFFETDGPTRRQYDSRRAYHRFYLRRRAILLHEGASLGAYTKDISRTGVAFLSPVQLFPRDVVHLVLPGPKKAEIQVRRCRRLGVACYECGGLFMTPHTDLDGLLTGAAPA